MLLQLTVLLFSVQKRTEWALVGVASSQLGSADRIRQTMLSVTTQLQESLSVSQAREIALQRRVEEVESEMRETGRRYVQLYS